VDVLPDEQEAEIRAAARTFLEAECPTSLVRAAERSPAGLDLRLWSAMNELGWTGASLSADVGGQELPLTVTGLLLAEAGRHLAPVPLLPATVAALMVDKYGTTQQRQLAADVAAGRAIATYALLGPTGSIACLPDAALTAVRVGDELELSGTMSFVDAADVADWLLVAAREESGQLRVLVVSTDLPGLSVQPLVSTAKDRQGKMNFVRVRVPLAAELGPPGAGAAVLEDVFQHAVALLCAQIGGAARKDMELAVAYAKQRHAFGRPIGSFQALQHLCADMLIQVDGIELLAAEAIWRLSDGRPADVEVSQAKAFAAEHAIAVCRASQQIHGGIGFMLEFDLQLWYRRVASWCLRLGGAPEHRARIASALLDTPASRAPVRLGESLSRPASGAVSGLWHVG
jgi:alkylation response protein AidB-like acyl-CoA dehydrogenase